VSELSDAKAALVAHLQAILAAGLPKEQVKVLPYEPRDVPGERITVSVTPSNVQADYLTFVTRIYCPFPDPAKGQERLEDAVAVIDHELGAAWQDPVWQFGWSDRLDVFAGEATIAYVREMI
jgi:hypothetical protein